jgi:hypothetical protein
MALSRFLQRPLGIHPSLGFVGSMGRDDKNFRTGRTDERLEEGNIVSPSTLLVVAHGRESLLLPTSKTDGALQCETTALTYSS